MRLVGDAFFFLAVRFAGRLLLLDRFLERHCPVWAYLCTRCADFAFAMLTPSRARDFAALPTFYRLARHSRALVPRFDESRDTAKHTAKPITHLTMAHLPSTAAEHRHPMTLLFRNVCRYYSSCEIGMVSEV